jgi:hypothetical protein
MKNPFQPKHIPTPPSCQQRVSSTPPALRDLTDADLKHVQGGFTNREHGQGSQGSQGSQGDPATMFQQILNQLTQGQG